MGWGIALGGFMGSGKSTVGRALAARLDWLYVDTDAVLSSRFGPCGLQIRQEGEAVFRAREAAVLEELSAQGGHAQVLATGGGAWVDPANRAALRRTHRLAVLHAPFEVLAARVGGDPSRPLWDASVRARYASRQAAYADADLQVDATRPVQVIVEELASWWCESSTEPGPTGSSPPLV